VYFIPLGLHKEAIMIDRQLPDDSQIYKALYDVQRRMKIIAAVLKDRIPQLDDLNDKIELSVIRRQLLVCVDVLNDLAGRRYFTEDGEPVWETCKG
jgi:hypothetical protein